MKDTYQKALIEIFQDNTDPEVILAGFKATLKKRGHERLYVPVLRSVLRILAAKRPTTVVTVAKESDSTVFANAIATILQELGATESSAAQVDETLIGGFVVEHDHKRVDNSYKAKLVRLYRSLTT